MSLLLGFGLSPHQAAGSVHPRMPTRPPLTSRSELLARDHAQTPQLSNWPQATVQHHITPRSISRSTLQSKLNMAPKARVPEKPSAPAHSTPAVKSTPGASKPSKSGSVDAQAIMQDVWNKYVQKTPQRVKLLDSFMVFLVVVGVLQFAYCLIVGNFVCAHQWSRYSISLAIVPSPS